MKKIMFIAIGLMYCLAFAAPAKAINLGSKMAKDAATEAGYAADTDQNTMVQIIGKIIKAVLSVAGVIFTVLIFYAGQMWMLARGEQEPIEKARKMIFAAVFGLIISLAAYTISDFTVKTVLERATTTQSTAPPK